MLTVDPILIDAEFVSTVGSEYLVNTTTESDQTAPVIAMDAIGNYVVVWQSNLQDGSGYGIYAQRYMADGAPDGPEFRVNSTTEDHQQQPTIAMTADGRFVIAWTSNLQDGGGNGVYAQRYLADGTPDGSEFQVNSTTDGSQALPAVAISADGRFVIAWYGNGQGDSRGIHAQRFSADGAPVDDEFLVNSTTDSSQTAPKAAMGADGRFIISWSSNLQDGSGYGIFAQRYVADGTPDGSEFLVNSTTANDQTSPTVAMGADGRFVIAWTSNVQDGSGYGVYAQRYLADGTPDGPEFLVNSTTANDQSLPNLAIGAAGRFVIAWQSLVQDGSSWGVYAQLYEADGTPVGDEFRVNSTTEGLQTAPSVAMSADGRFAIAWPSNPLDGSGYDVYAQRYLFSPETGGPYVIAEGSDLTLDASTADASIVSYAWDLDGDGQYDDASGATPTISAATLAALGLAARGEYLISLGMTDDEGNFRAAATTVTVVNAPPTLSINSISPVRVANQAIDIVASATDVADPPETLTYLYEIFADGADAPAFTGSGVNLTNFQFTPTSGGNYEIVLTVSDQEGGSSQVRKTIFVNGVAAVGPEARVNTTTLGDQLSPVIAMDAVGNYVVVWYGNGPDDNSGIYAQRYLADGTPNGAEFRVNAHTANIQELATVAMNANGRFVIAWLSDRQDGSDGGIFAQRYLANGALDGPEFLVNSTTEYTQYAPTAAIGADGQFVIAWHGNGPGDYPGIFAQRYLADGTPNGSEFRVNSATEYDQQFPTASMSADGRFVIAWQSNLQDGSGYGIYAQRFLADGTPAGPEFRVNSTTASSQVAPTAVMTGDGQFLIVWHGNGPGDSDGVFAQRYLADGTPNGEEFLVNSNTVNGQGRATAAIDADGQFVIAWDSNSQDGSGFGVYAQRYRADGTLEGAEFRVNSTTIDHQYDPTVAISAAGQFVIAWQSLEQDGSYHGIYAQRYVVVSEAGGPYVIEEGSDLTLEASTVDASIVSYAWDLDGDGQYDDATGATPTISAATLETLGLNARGVHTIELGMTDDEGNFHVAPTTVTVVNAPPTTLSIDSISPVRVANQAIDIVASAVDLADSPETLTYLYEIFADGADVPSFTGSGVNLTTFAFTPTAGGNYELVITVSDQEGGSSQVRKTIFVNGVAAVGPETRVNATTLGGQQSPVIAMDAVGNYVVVWHGAGPDNNIGVYAQRYLADGAPNGPEFRVNATPANNQQFATVAMNADGRFVVAWQSDLQDGSGWGIYAQRYQADGTPEGSEFRVNSTTDAQQLSAAAAITADGRFVITWIGNGPGDNNGIYAQRYLANGMPDGPEFRVNTTTAESQQYATLAMSADGRFVIAWQSFLQDGSGWGIYAQRYLDDGTPDGAEFRVNSTTGDTQAFPRAAMSADGRFVIAWHSYQQDGSGYGVYAQRYLDDGTPDGPEFLVNSTTEDQQIAPATAMSADGQFVIAWRSYLQDGSGYGVYAQRYQADGTPDGSEFLVNSTTEDQQLAPTATMGIDGRFVIAWQSNLQDGSGYGIFAQQYLFVSEAGGPYVIADGSDLALEASVKEANVVSYAWDLDGDGQYDDATGATPTISAETLATLGLSTRGVHTIALRMTDDEGNFRVAPTTVTVVNAPPTPSIDAISPDRVANQAIDIVASATDVADPSETLTYLYEIFADGADVPSFTDSGVNLTTFQFTPTTGGNYEVVLTVSDQEGASSQVRQTIFVNGVTTVGPETLVNTTTLGDQRSPVIAMDAVGNYVVVWQSYLQDGSNYDYGIYAQRYLADGAPIGPEFRVNSSTEGAMGFPAAAMTADGRFVIAWERTDGSGYDIYAQRYLADGTPDGPEFRVNSTTTGGQTAAATAMAADGRFVICWQSSNQDGSRDGIFGQRYRPDGTPDGPEFRVNSTTENNQQESTLAMSADGRFVIAWQSYRQDGSELGIYAQRYQADGTVEGPEFRVNTTTADNQALPSVAIGMDGRFVITWTSNLQDGSGWGVYAQRYLADGTADGPEFRVNSTIANDQVQPTAAMNAGGRFVIAWESVLQDGSAFGVYAQRYLADGTPDGPEFRVNTTTADNQESPSVAIGADGRFAIAWESYLQGGSFWDIYAQRYTFVSEAGGPYVIDEEGDLALAASVADANVVSYAWDLDGDGQYDDATGATPTISAETLATLGLSARGVHTIALRMTDDEGNFHVAPTTVTVVNAPPTPSIDAISPDRVANQAIDIVASATDVADPPETLTYLYEIFADGADVPSFTDSGVNLTNFQFTPTSGGSYEVVLTVSDQEGASSQVRQTIFVNGVAAVGPETRVNTTTIGEQRSPVIAMDAVGNYIVVWYGNGPDNDFGIYAQRFLADGAPDGQEFRVGSPTAIYQEAPTVAMSADGRFVIAWQSNQQDGSDFGIYAQRYLADGTADGPEFRVNSTTAGPQLSPTAAITPDGRFAIAWWGNGSGDNQGVFAQRYLADGTPEGTEFRVNTTTAESQLYATLAMSANGRFVIAWTSNLQDGSGTGIYAQRYLANGVPDGPEFRVNTTTESVQSNPTVAIDGDGRFVIAWDSALQDGSNYGIYAQRYLADGTPDGPEFRVNSTTENTQANPTAVMSGDGRFVIAWESNLQDGSEYGIYAQRYLADGTPEGPEFRVNTTTEDQQLAHTATMSVDGRFVIAWQSNLQDGSGYGIYAQRYLFVSEAGGPYVINEESDLTLAASVAEANVVSYAWDLDGDGQYDDATGATPTISAATLATLGLNARGVHTIALRMTDDEGNFRVAPATVTVVNAPPKASLYSTPLVRIPNQPINVIGSATDLADPPETLTYRYEVFQDGVTVPAFTGSGVNLTTFQFTPTTGGSFHIVLTVTDQEGGSSQARKTIFVDGVTTEGPEVRVNTTTTDEQTNPVIATNAVGDYVVVWNSNLQDGSGTGIYAQRYLSDGTPNGPEFRVNSTTANNQQLPTVAMSADGRFVIAWQSDSQDGSGDGIYAQRYLADGTPDGPEFRVNTTTENHQGAATVAMSADGQFVIAWSSNQQDGSFLGVYAQRYLANGTPNGTEFRVNSTTSGGQSSPTAAIDADGRFVIAWQSDHVDGSNDVFAQRYRVDGTPDGPEFRVNFTTENEQQFPSVAMNADRFVIAWQSNSQDGSSGGIYAQRYLADGTPDGPEFQVNSTTEDHQANPTVAISVDGRFVITWQSNLQDGSGYGVYAQRYDVDGTPDGEEFRVNSTTASNQYLPSAAVSAEGKFVIAWSTYSLESSSYEIDSQLFHFFPKAGGPYAIDEGADLTLDASTAGANVVSYEWDLDGDGQYDDASGVAPTISAASLASFGLGSAGVYEIVLKYANDQGVIRYAAAILTVQNVPPMIAADVSSVIISPGAMATATGTYSDPGGNLLAFSASVGNIVDNLDGTWSWSLADAQLSDSQLVEITVDDGNGGISQATFQLNVLPQADAFITISDTPATTDASGEAATLPSDLESIHEWQKFTVNVWIRYDEQYVDDLTGVSLKLDYNSEWFDLHSFTPSSGVGQLSVVDTGDALEVTAGQLVAGDVGRTAYFLIGSFRFQPNSAGGLPNDVVGAYPEAVADLQFALADVELMFVNAANLPAELNASPTTQMRVVPFDIDDDNTVTLVDLAYLIRQIGDNVNFTPAAYRFDFDQDGVVSLVDLAYFIRNVGINSNDGNSVRLPPLPQTQPLSAPLESESISLATNTILPGASSTPLLEGEMILPQQTLPAPHFFAANVDAAFGNLDSPNDWPTSQAESQEDEPIVQTLTDAQDPRRFSYVPDWVLHESAIIDILDGTTRQWHEEMEEEAGPPFHQLLRGPNYQPCQTTRTRPSIPRRP
ncbi:hypothetical protein LOC68_00945 [Blastopirellula sp. JC732]|uniref:EF-hand domain-containing protein n=1 Tax=Blastopirellula sediminis TaxID=2894196 RepID=A0A9X1MHP2_9BACT|nr:hypothetical protein [Blastopirellula sediminis]MCC9608246.1 hypothetical protein [Blastopirellula sediminis]MCC9626961.1 hypothetical protein [Blastopirellula sediminis]